MDKSTIAAIVFAGISAVLFTERGVRYVKEKKKERAVAKNLQWHREFMRSEQIPYQGKWSGETLAIGGEWDSIYLDTALVVGKIYSCYGPNNSNAVIVVTALYGPVAITYRDNVVSYAGHPKLALLKHDEQPIFSRPLDTSWLGSVLNPESEVYSASTNIGWTTLYDSINEINNFQTASRAMEAKINALAIELAEKAVLNDELRTALKLCQSSCQEEEFESYKEVGVSDGTFGNATFVLPIIDTANAKVTWTEAVEHIVDIEDVVIQISDIDIFADFEEAANEPS
jgi:hypothetical protein